MEDIELKYSIAMCTYNGEKYIKEQLDSFAIQTILPTELIICDDGSTDNTAKMVQEYSESVTFKVKFLVNEKNLGVTKNFEKACRNCNNEIIFFSDQDDIWMQEKAEKILRILENYNNINLVMSDAVLFGENCDKDKGCLDTFHGKKEKVFNKNKQFNVSLMCCICTGATMVAKKCFIDKCMPFPQFLFHDQWLSLIASLYNSIYICNEKLIKYRQHKSQVIGGKQLNINEQIEKQVDYIAQSELFSNIYQEINKNENIKITDKDEALLLDFIKFLQYREKNKNYNFFKKNTNAIKMLARGKYNLFTGHPFYSFLKDITRKEKCKGDCNG